MGTYGQLETQYRRFVGVGLALALVAQGIAFSGIIHGPFERWAQSLESPVISAVFAAVFVLFALTRPRRPLWICAVFMSLASAGSLTALWSDAMPIKYVIQNSLGIGAVSAFVWGALLGPIDDRPRMRVHLLQSVLLVLFARIAWTFLDLSSAMWPTTFDGEVFATSHSLGVNPAWWMFDVFQNTPWLKTLCKWVYDALPLAFAVLFATAPRRPSVTTIDPTRAFLYCAIGGYTLYNFFPSLAPSLCSTSPWPRPIRPTSSHNWDR